MRTRSCLLRILAAWIVALSCARTASAENYSDIWWNPGESGWGVTIADHETNLFGVLYAYRADGHPVWYTIPGGTFAQGHRLFQGDVYITRGPAYTNPVFDSSLVKATQVGTANFDFTPPGFVPGIALFSYTIDGIGKTKQIQRQPFGNAAPNWGYDKTDLWFNPDESGWGVSLAHHGNNIFGVWYAYDVDGEPLWFVLPGGTFAGPDVFSGALYRTTGPYFGNATFDPALVKVTQVGSATLTFSGSQMLGALAGKADTACPGISATFVATVDGTSYPRLACPQPFGRLAPSGPTPGSLAIILTDPLPDATWGQPYSQLAATATGGSPPYHFQSDTFANGAPPPGLVVTLDGLLQGTPSGSLTSTQSYIVGICVVDVAGASNCAQTLITVQPPMPTGSMSWTVSDQCNNGDEIDYRFHDDSNHLVWPSATTEYYMFYGDSYQNSLACVPNAQVCIGGQSGSGALYWGVGLNDTHGCTACCANCAGQTVTYNFGCSTPNPGGGSWYAHWNCQSQSQCIAVVGSNTGTAGPFTSQAACDQWRETYFFGAVCNQSP